MQAEALELLAELSPQLLNASDGFPLAWLEEGRTFRICRQSKDFEACSSESK